MPIRTIEEALAYRLQMMNLAASADDNTAAKNADVFSPWVPDIEITQEMIDKNMARYKYSDAVYRAKQPHTTQLGWEPNIATSLFDRLDVEHEGTLDDPIPAYANMVYEQGKYYVENDIIYLCIRNTEIAVAYTPSQLVGQYFEVV